MKGDKGFLREKMQSYQVEPPAEVWQSVEAGIRGRGRKRMLIFGLSAAASLALAITLGINLFSPGDRAGQELATSEEEKTERATTTESGEQAKITNETDQDGKQEEVKTQLASDEPLQETSAHRIAIVQPQVTGPAETKATEEPEEPEEHWDIGDPGDAGRNISKESLEETVLEKERGEETPIIAEYSREEAKDLLEEALAQLPEQDETGNLELELPREPRWILGAVFSPIYSYRDATDNAVTGTAGQESGMISYAGGMQVAYRTTRRLALETGIIFNKMGLEIPSSGILNTAMSFDNVPVGSDRYNEEVKAVTSSMGNIVSNEGEIFVNNYKVNSIHGADAANNLFGGIQSYDDLGIRQHLDYLEIPLNLRYTLVDRKLKLQLMGGMSTNLLVNNYVTMEGPDGRVEIGYLSNVKNLNYSGNAGLGLSYSFFSNLSVGLEPRFRYYLNSVNDGSLPATRPFTFGLYTGLSYTF